MFLIWIKMLQIKHILTNQQNWTFLLEVDFEILSLKSLLSSPERELENYKAAFLEHDEDGSGNISTEELGAVMKKLGDNPTEVELLDLVNKVGLPTQKLMI